MHYIPFKFYFLTQIIDISGINIISVIFYSKTTFDRIQYSQKSTDLHKSTDIQKTYIFCRGDIRL